MNKNVSVTIDLFIYIGARWSTRIAFCLKGVRKQVRGVIYEMSRI